MQTLLLGATATTDSGETGKIVSLISSPSGFGLHVQLLVNGKIKDHHSGGLHSVELAPSPQIEVTPIKLAEARTSTKQTKSVDSAKDTISENK